MSWYNQDNTDFIDSTQQFQGGVGGSIVIDDGTGNNGSFQLTDILELKLDHFENEYEQTNPSLVYNTYLKNENAIIKSALNELLIAANKNPI